MLHVSSNLSGSLMIKPLKKCFLNPGVKKNISETQLPVFWRSNKKTWTTQDLFKDWFYNCFMPAVNLYDGKIICTSKYFSAQHKV